MAERHAAPSVEIRPADLDRLAAVLARLLLSAWRRRGEAAQPAPAAPRPRPADWRRRGH